jgi:ATP-binding cassette subfamily F protein 3
MLSVSNLSKSFGARYLFSGVTFNIGMKDRIAVIGQNGTGKTTLFEIIAGTLSPDSGTVSISRGTTLGYLRQDTRPASGRKLLEEIVSSAAEINNLAHKIRLLHEELAQKRTTTISPTCSKNSENSRMRWS